MQALCIYNRYIECYSVCRTHSRLRTRSRSNGRSPQCSSFHQEGPIKADQIKKLLQEQEKTLSDLVINHKEELEEIVRSKTTPILLKCFVKFKI